LSAFWVEALIAPSMMMMMITAPAQLMVRPTLKLVVVPTQVTIFPVASDVTPIVAPLTKYE
jgi:hypothetical protein